MDPDTALAILRANVLELKRLESEDHIITHNESTFVEAFSGLDGWLSMGGFYPQAWSPTTGIVQKGE